MLDTSFGLDISSIHDDVGVDGLSVQVISTESSLDFDGKDGVEMKRVLEDSGGRKVVIVATFKQLCRQ